ncbi:MAG: proliferating cell nuclear antigen (pcna) [Candidatus Methanomethylicota archaeon]|uniref:DNA polymerase sliding clamp n=1 Tax=Thermoproteota archaeon TaxID=2056631 RepID=A0A497F281_9CREN|nr:MAG: proliferating cell nuclear antigen (pcna) [Candidatus Verstraetearchaeota archaeon]
MVFKAVFSDARLWRKIIDAISMLIEEASFIATPNGLMLRAMDPSRVAMVDFELQPLGFEEYSCDSEVVLGVNFDDIKKVMKRASASDKLELEHDPVQNRLKVKLKGRATRVFAVPLLELGREEFSTPKVPFNVTVRMLSETLEDAIKDASVVSDYVRFEADQSSFRIKASGDRGEVEVSVDKDSGGLLGMEIKEPSHALYSLNYLENMMKAADAADVVLVKFSTNMPLGLDFELPNGRITYYLAPRMEAET